MTAPDLSALISEIVEAAIVAEMELEGWQPFYSMSLADLGSAQHGLASRPSRFEKLILGTVIRISHSGEYLGEGVDDRGAARAEEGIATLASAKSKWSEKIPALFEPYLDLPIPSDFAEAASGVDKPAELLSAGYVFENSEGGTVVDANRKVYDLLGCDDELLHWHGLAADNFRRTFVENLPATTKAQFHSVTLIKGAVERERAIWTAARQDVVNLAVASREAMRGCATGDGNADLELAIFGAVAGVASIFLPVVGQVALAAAAGALSVASTLSAEEAEPSAGAVSGATPNVVFDSMKSELTALNGAIRSGENGIAKQMDSLAAQMGSHRRTFHPGEARKFLSLTSPTALDDTRGIDVDTSRLRYFTKTAYAAAPEFSSAAHALVLGGTIFARPSAVGSGVYGPYYSILDAIESLREILVETAFFVEETGEHVAICADYYDGTDRDVVAARFEKHAEQVRVERDKSTERAPAPPLPPRSRQKGIVP